MTYFLKLVSEYPIAFSSILAITNLLWLIFSFYQKHKLDKYLVNYKFKKDKELESEKHKFQLELEKKRRNFGIKQEVYENFFSI